MNTRARTMVPTLAALGGLAAGFGLGIILHGSTDPWVERLMTAVAAMGELWVAALRMAGAEHLAGRRAADLHERSDIRRGSEERGVMDDS